MVMTACTKSSEPGPQGVQGPRGDIGPQGPQGAQGSQGTPGADGSPGANAVVKTEPELAGMHCATGGVKFTAGMDANRNGTLDPEEVNPEATRYLCNGPQGPQGPQGPSTGTPGLNALVLSSPEAAGAHCATGGVRLQSGLDADGDGTLSSEEIDESLTRYVCNGAQGPPVLRGEPCMQGPAGHQGDKGDTCAQGEQGPKGDTVAQCPQGP